MARRTINQDSESLAREAIDSVIERLDEAAQAPAKSSWHRG